MKKAILRIPACLHRINIKHICIILELDKSLILTLWNEFYRKRIISAIAQSLIGAFLLYIVVCDIIF